MPHTNYILLYLDPGTGSFLYQAIIAGITAIVFYFSSFKKIFKKLLKTKNINKNDR